MGAEAAGPGPGETGCETIGEPDISETLGDSNPWGRQYSRFALLVGAGWLSTNIGYSIAELPMKFLLKDRLHQNAEAVALFFAVSQFTNYIKPVAGVLTDAIPLFGTRRRHYLLLSLSICGLMWLVMGIIPQTYHSFLYTYTFLHIFIVLISTTLGGVMAEGGERFRATGRLSAQRVGIFRIVGLIGGPVGGWLASRAFLMTGALAAGFHFILVPLYYVRLRETKKARVDSRKLEAVREQGRVLVRSRTLWAAAGLIFLVIAAPGFNTPLFFYETDKLHFSPEFIGVLKLVDGACGVAGAYLFSHICRHFGLRPLLAIGIATHVVAALLFLGLRSRESALVITGLYSAAQTAAILPLYDLAMRATPKGSEALGYSVMMSVFNLTTALSDVVGSRLTGRMGFSFSSLIWLNAGSTALVLIAIPFLPRLLTDRRDGEIG